jgi:lysophospholipase L1-like esterase
MTSLRSIVCLAVVLIALGIVAHVFGADANNPTPSSDSNIHLRSPFQNARIRFETQKKGHVAFIGGSITQMNGYRPMVMEVLKKRFPMTEFTVTQAGISSTCSTTGAFRLQDHVLSKGPVDLFFVEFAVNDDQDAAHARRECIRGMEGVIRHTLKHNPKADIVVTYFVNPGMLKTWQSGKVPLSAGAHDEVTKHYKVSTINLAKETADQITAGSMTWKQFGGTHPKPPGNRLCANMIDRLMALAWAKPLAADAKTENNPLPKKPLDANSYFNGRLIDPKQAKIVNDMAVHKPDWKKIGGGFRSQFAPNALLCGDKPGAQATLEFQGTAVGAYVLAGPDAGIVEASVDGGEYKKVNLFHRYSRGLHYPRTVMFDADLKPGKHTLKLRISKDKDPKSKGNAMRVLYFVAN